MNDDYHYLCLYVSKQKPTYDLFAPIPRILGMKRINYLKANVRLKLNKRLRGPNILLDLC